MQSLALLEKLPYTQVQTCQTQASLKAYPNGSLALARAHKKMTAQSKGVSSTSREKTLRRSTLQIHDTWKEVEIMRKLHCLWHLDCKPVFLLSMQVKASCHTYFYQWKKIEGLSKSRPLTLNAFIFSIYVWPHFLTFFTHCVCCILFSIQWLDDIFLEQLGKS